MQERWLLNVPFCVPRPQAASVADQTSVGISVVGDHVLSLVARSKVVRVGGGLVLQSAAEDGVDGSPLLISGLRERQVVKGWTIRVVDLAPEEAPVPVSTMVLVHQSLLLADVLGVEEASRLVADDSNVILRHR